LVIIGIIGIIQQKNQKEKIAKEIATGDKPQEKDETIKMDISKKDKTDVGTLYIYRLPAFIASRDPFQVNLNDQIVAQLKNGSYAILKLPAGQHFLKLSTVKPEIINLDVQPGKKYYIKFQVLGITKRIFKNVSVDEGESAIQVLKQIPNDSVNIHYRA
jgi:hypothetical protein